MEKKEALRLIEQELERATNRFKAFNSAHEGYAVILEELDELWEEVRAKTGMKSKKRMEIEAIQVGAMAARFLVDLIEK